MHMCRSCILYCKKLAILWSLLVANSDKYAIFFVFYTRIYFSCIDTTRSWWNRSFVVYISCSCNLYVVGAKFVDTTKESEREKGRNTVGELTDSGVKENIIEPQSLSIPRRPRGDTTIYV